MMYKAQYHLLERYKQVTKTLHVDIFKNKTKHYTSTLANVNFVSGRIDSYNFTVASI